MSSEIQETIYKLRDEVAQMTSKPLDKNSDEAALWQRSQEIRIILPTIRSQAESEPPDAQAGLEEALGQIDSGLKSLQAANNRPDELPSDEEVLKTAVRSIYSQSLQIASDFALEKRDRGALRVEAGELHRELILLAKSGANKQPNLQRLLSDSDLDLTYVASDGKRPHSTRLAHYLADARRSDSSDS
jgi:hypothetical protein